MIFFNAKSKITFKDVLNCIDMNFNDSNCNFEFENFIRADLAGSNDLTFYSDTKYACNTNSKYILTSKNLSKKIDDNKITIISNNISLDIAKLSNLFYKDLSLDQIQKLKKPVIGDNSIISKFSIIENGTVVGRDFNISDFSSIGYNCSIGDRVSIGKNVSISNTIIGDDVVIGNGSKIGQPGFGFGVDTETYNPTKIFHIGRVIIQNGVNINCNCTVDRGSFKDTIIGEYTHIDNLVHIAHNLEIVHHCMIAGQVGIAGSALIGNYVQIGGQAGISGHIIVNDNVKIAAKSGVIRDVIEGDTLMGYPAINIKKYLRNHNKIMGS